MLVGQHDILCVNHGDCGGVALLFRQLRRRVGGIPIKTDDGWKVRASALTILLNAESGAFERASGQPDKCFDRPDCSGSTLLARLTEENVAMREAINRANHDQCGCLGGILFEGIGAEIPPVWDSKLKRYVRPGDTHLSKGSGA